MGGRKAWHSALLIESDLSKKRETRFTPKTLNVCTLLLLFMKSEFSFIKRGCVFPFQFRIHLSPWFLNYERQRNVTDLQCGKTKACRYALCLTDY